MTFLRVSGTDRWINPSSVQAVDVDHADAFQLGNVVHDARHRVMVQVGGQWMVVYEYATSVEAVAAATDLVRQCEGAVPVGDRP